MDIRRCSCGLMTTSDDLWDIHVELHRRLDQEHRELRPDELPLWCWEAVIAMMR